MLPTDKRILDLNVYQLEFIEYSMIYDDPEAKKQLENTTVDPDWDEYEKEFAEEQEQSEQAKKLKEEKEKAKVADNAYLRAFETMIYGSPRTEEYIISQPKDIEQSSDTIKQGTLETEEYIEPASYAEDDWEKVDL